MSGEILDPDLLREKYPDIEIPIFFEDSEEEEAVVVPKPKPEEECNFPVTQEQISCDLARLNEALLQQPFRASEKYEYRKKVEAGDLGEWENLSKRPKVLVQTEIKDIMKPALLSGLLEQWKAREKWKTVDALIENYGNLSVVATRLVAAHEMGKSFPVSVKLASFLHYCQNTYADFPLYVFDHTLPSGPMKDDYVCPPHKVFEKDLFDPSIYPSDFPRDSLGFFNKNEWSIIGGKLSGSPLHKDPEYTCAWNALLQGKKRWAVFPPHIDKERLRKLEDHEPPAKWFFEVLPELRKEKDLGLIEIMQEEGDMVYLPEGWWHAVLNIELSVAVTHNAFIPATLPHMRERLEHTHKEFLQAIKRYGYEDN